MSKKTHPSKGAPNTSKGNLNLSKAAKGKGMGKGKGKAYVEPQQPNSQVSQGKIQTSVKAGLQFSVARVARRMKMGRYAERIGGGAPINMAAALQYITSELAELAGNKAEENKKSTIKPRHVMLAIREDIELNKLLGNADFAECGVVPRKAEDLKKGKKGKKCFAEDEEMQDEDAQ